MSGRRQGLSRYPLTNAELAEINKGWREFGKEFPSVAIQQAKIAETNARNHQDSATEHHEFARRERARAQALREGAAGTPKEHSKVEGT
jgi:hypothetical protein